MESEQKLNIYQKLHAVMSECGFIAKDKTNEHQRYKYASEEAIKKTLHPLLVKHGLLFVPLDTELLAVDQVADSKQRVTTIKLHYQFHDIETGETIDAWGIGSGADSMDKGTFKALTGAIKYAMTSTFLIPTGDDPEADGKPAAAPSAGPQRASSGPRKQSPDGVITEPQQKRIFALMNKSGKTVDQVKEIIAKHGYASSKEIKVKDYDAIVAEVEGSNA